MIIYSPSTNDDLSSGTLSNTSLNDIPEVDLLDTLSRDTSFLDSMLDSGDTKLGRFDRCESSVDTSDRSSGGGENEDGLEGGLSSVRIEVQLTILRILEDLEASLKDVDVNIGYG